MEPIPKYGGTSSLGALKKKTQPPRRVWSSLEEQMLITCLHEMIANGWKADNGFKPGYLQQLELTINERLPGSNICPRHINSKLTVWKKHYYLLLAMLGTSGFGWNDTSKLIEVNDDIWIQYVAANREVNTMRRKAWIYYDDWCEIFGKDRANGEDAEGFCDVVEDILLTEKHVVHDGGKGKSPLDDLIGVDLTNDDSVVSSPCIDLTTEASDGGGAGGLKATMKHFGIKTGGIEKKKKFKIKREKKERTPDSNKTAAYAPLLTNFIEDAKSTFGNLNSKFNKAADTDDEKASKVISALEDMSGLSEEHMNILCYKIMDNPKHTALFLRSSPRNREIQAQMILEGQPETAAFL